MVAKIGPFEILEPVGRGGMGSVFRALDPMIGRLVAVKIVRLIGYNDGDEAAFLKDRLLREAKAAGSLLHAGIVTIYQVGVCNDQAYIAMEYIDGPTLQQQLASQPRAEPALFCRVLTETAAALDYAHSRGVVHRDVKPANIMFTGCGAVKVTDFGIAKTMLGHTQTETGAILGTPYYMSPEQVNGRPLDGRSDQFALAIIAYEMLSGRLPFNGEQVTSICYQIVHAEPISLLETNPELGKDVTATLSKALSKDPERRYPTCSEFASALVTAHTRVVENARALRTFEEEKTQVVFPADRREKHKVGSRLSSLLALHYPSIIVAVGLISVLMILSKVLTTTENHLSSPTASRSSPIASSERPRAELEKPVSIKAMDSRTEANGNAPSTSTNRLPRFPSPDPGSANTPITAPKSPPKPSLPEIGGRIVWKGEAVKGTLLEIGGNHVSNGELNGRFPGTPIKVEVFPAEETAQGLTVFTSDERYAEPKNESTPFGPAMFFWDPRHVNDLSIWEEPGPLNGWATVILRINAPKLSGCVVQWREVSQSQHEKSR